MRRIVVEPPQSDARRERVERKLFEQLAAVKVVERAEAVIPPPRRPRWQLAMGGGLLAAAAVVAVLVLGGGEDASDGTIPSPSRGSSRQTRTSMPCAPRSPRRNGSA